jgi:hypothetical protein
MKIHPVFTRKLVAAYANAPPSIINAYDQMSAFGVQEGGNTLEAGMFHSAIILACFNVPAKRGLEFNSSALTLSNQHFYLRATSPASDIQHILTAGINYLNVSVAKSLLQVPQEKVDALLYKHIQSIAWQLL